MPALTFALASALASALAFASTLATAQRQRAPVVVGADSLRVSTLNCTLCRRYVACICSHRIEVFTLDGEHLFGCGGRGRDAGRFLGPWGVAARRARVFVSECVGRRVQVYLV